MSTQSAGPQSVKNLGVQVTLAGLGINLALGILYSWSVIKAGIPEDWGWTSTDGSWPYAVACLVFSFIMVPAGRMQDKFGPRLVASIGGVLVGLGMIIASQTTSPVGYLVGFGVLAGAGIGFGYASATPPAVKWFPSAKTGLIAGIVVSGFGIASVYIAPLARWAIGTMEQPNFGVQNTVLAFGIAFLVVVVGLAQLLKAPPKGFVPAGTPAPTATSGPQKKEDFTPGEMLGTAQFYLLWLAYACGAGAGLMIISKLSVIGSTQAGVNGMHLVVAMGVGNGVGRVFAGFASDKLGRRVTMIGFFIVQAIFILLLSFATQGTPLAAYGIMLAIAFAIGANYGSNLTLFPSITKDYFGVKNFGMNYGLVFTAWGAGGFMLSMGSGALYDEFKTFSYAYYGAATLLVLGAIIATFIKPPHHAHEPAELDKAQPAHEPKGTAEDSETPKMVS